MIIDDFLLYALIAGFFLALVSGPLGCIIVWRRMAYFGDTLSHAALLGIAIAVAVDMLPMIGVAIIGSLLAVSLFFLERNKQLSNDTLLGILSHSALALGLIVIALVQESGRNLNLMGYLFGDILAVTPADLAWIYAGGGLVLATLAAIWRPLLALTVHEELARVEGAPVILVRLIFMLLIALVIAVAMKIVGILLITSLLIIPAASARRLARNPEQMAGLAVVYGWLAVALGLWGSLQWDTPTGPSVVVAAAALFLLSQLMPLGRRGAG